MASRRSGAAVRNWTASLEAVICVWLPGELGLAVLTLVFLKVEGVSRWTAKTDRSLVLPEQLHSFPQIR